MTARDLVELDPRARRCWPWLPALVREGRIFVGPLGEVLRAREDGAGAMDVLVRGGTPWNRSVAADATPGRRAP